VPNSRRFLRPDIELAAAGILHQGIEAWPLIASLGAADAGIAVDFGHLPVAAFGDVPDWFSTD
jgi:hypothetical protein